MSLWYGRVLCIPPSLFLPPTLFPPPSLFLPPSLFPLQPPLSSYIYDIVQGMNGPLLTPYKAEKGLQEVLRNLDGTPRSLEEIATRIKLAMDKVTNHICFTTLNRTGMWVSPSSLHSTSTNPSLPPFLPSSLPPSLSSLPLSTEHYFLGALQPSCPLLEDRGSGTTSNQVS